MKSKDSDSKKPTIVNFYSQSNERDRLTKHVLERDRTLEILKKRLPKNPVSILDVGGAAGVYAFPLASLGHKVHLIDPVALHIDQAKAYAREQKIHLAGYSVGDARELQHANASVDVVLLFGPLYHLFEKQDRIQALQEAWRVLKNGGLIFAAAIPRCAALMDAMNKGTLYRKLKFIEQSLLNGVHHKQSENLDFLYLHEPSELKAELEQCGFKDLSVISIEGPVWHEQVVEDLHKDARNWQCLLSLLEKIEADEHIIGASAHIMGLGKKV